MVLQRWTNSIFLTLISSYLVETTARTEKLSKLRSTHPTLSLVSTTLECRFANFFSVANSRMGTVMDRLTQKESPTHSNVSVKLCFEWFMLFTHNITKACTVENLSTHYYSLSVLLSALWPRSGGGSLSWAVTVRLWLWCLMTHGPSGHWYISVLSRAVCNHGNS